MHPVLNTQGLFRHPSYNLLRIVRGNETWTCDFYTHGFSISSTASCAKFNPCKSQMAGRESAAEYKNSTLVNKKFRIGSLCDTYIYSIYTDMPSRR